MRVVSSVCWIYVVVGGDGFFGSRGLFLQFGRLFFRFGGLVRRFGFADSDLSNEKTCFFIRKKVVFCCKKSGFFTQKTCFFLLQSGVRLKRILIAEGYSRILIIYNGSALKGLLVLLLKSAGFLLSVLFFTYIIYRYTYIIYEVTIIII